jgi:hypothetical protein
VTETERRAAVVAEGRSWIGTPHVLAAAAKGAGAGSSSMTTTSFASGASIAVGDLLTLNVTQVGSSTPGQDLTIQLLLRRT